MREIATSARADYSLSSGHWIGPMVVSLKLFGGFDIRTGSGESPLIRTRKTRALLAYLATHADKPQPRERLMELLWGDRGTKQARQSLNNALMAIRHIGNREKLELIVSDREYVSLRSQAMESDVERFRQIIESEPAKAAELYDGPFLDGMTVPAEAFEDWLTTTRADLHDQACHALQRAADQAAVDGEFSDATGMTLRLLELDPLREDAHRRLMQLLLQCGDRTAALRQYDTCAQILERELRIEPDPLTRRLLAEIKNNKATGSVSLTEFGSRQELPAPAASQAQPSIAVLPFENMSDDAEQEFFADGIAEDLITALSRFRSLFVIARNSTFTYKGKAVDISRIARELGVRYVVEGSVRKAGNRVRITAQLIDALSGNHVWADRFDGNLDNVFDLQDQITEQIVVAVEPEIQARERQRVRRKPPESLEAWELLQRGVSLFYRFKKADHEEAIRVIREAIERDAEFSTAHAQLAESLYVSILFGFAEDKATALASARAFAEKAVSLDPNEPFAHYVLGRVHIHAGEIEMAIGEMERAIAINPNFALGYYGLGYAYYFGAGQAEQAIQSFETALRLSPRDPWRWVVLMHKGSALRFLGRNDEAITYCRSACQFPDTGFLPYIHLAAALAQAGQKCGAQATLEKAIELQPAFSISSFRDRLVGIHPPVLKNLLGNLREAGAPE